MKIFLEKFNSHPKDVIPFSSLRAISLAKLFNSFKQVNYLES